MRRTRWSTLAIVLALTATACGGDDDVADTTGTGTAAQGDTAGETGDSEQNDEEQVEAPPTPPSDDAGESNDSDPTASGDEAPVPIVRFAAHGPGAPNTIGPKCAVGIDNSGGDVFRFTAPTTWTWKGTSGGSGYDQVTLDADDVTIVVTESAYDYDTSILNEWQVIGPAGSDIEIDGVSIPIMEVSLEGGSGYAVVDLDYMSPVPGLTAGASLATVAVTSAEPGRPTLDEAADLLSTVRVERCAAVGEAMIWGPASGVRLVPRFEPDPLGKTYPEQPQPAYDPSAGVLASYSLEQVAYLMPVEPDVAMCAAEKAVEFEAGNPIAYLYMFTPSGTNTADLEAILAEC